jgi:hypothetical protein
MMFGLLGPSGAHLNQQLLQGDLVGPTGLAPTPQAGSQFTWYALVLKKIVEHIQLSNPVCGWMPGHLLVTPL